MGRAIFKAFDINIPNTFDSDPYGGDAVCCWADLEATIWWRCIFLFFLCWDNGFFLWILARKWRIKTSEGAFLDPCGG